MTTIDKIANSHYVPLQPPYPVIYCNNEVGIQIATLIVVTEPQMTAPVGNRSVYRMATHSHPIVTYGNKHLGISEASNIPGDYSEGEVWDKVVISNASVIAFVNNAGRVSPSDTVLLERLGEIILKGRLNEMFYGSPFNLSRIIYRLDLSGVQVPKQYSIFGKLRLVLGGSNKPEKQSVTSNNISNLPAFYIAAEWKGTDETEKELCRQVDDYIDAFAKDKNNKAQIEFYTHDRELQELAVRMNSHYHVVK